MLLTLDIPDMEYERIKALAPNQDVQTYVMQLIKSADSTQLVQTLLFDIHKEQAHTMDVTVTLMHEVLKRLDTCATAQVIQVAQPAQSSLPLPELVPISEPVPVPIPVPSSNDTYSGDDDDGDYDFFDDITR